MKCQEQLAVDLKIAKDTCLGMLSYMSAVSGKVSPYDQRIFEEDWALTEDPVINYFSFQSD
jgi:hypothetical protein